MSNLLPPNATELERNLDQVTSRISDVAVPLRQLWSIDDCPVALLPWLAWAMSVDTWNSAWSDTVKREVIRQSVEIHRRKGTIGAVRRAVAAIWGDAKVREWFNYGGDPFHFRVELQVETAGFDLETWDDVEAVVEGTKNVRSHLDTVAVYLTSRGEQYRPSATVLGETTEVQPYIVTELSDDLPAIYAAGIQQVETTIVYPLP